MKRFYTYCLLILLGFPAFLCSGGDPLSDSETSDEGFIVVMPGSAKKNKGFLSRILSSGQIKHSKSVPLLQFASSVPEVPEADRFSPVVPVVIQPVEVAEKKTACCCDGLVILARKMFKK